MLNGFAVTGGLSNFLSSIIAWLFGLSIIQIVFGTSLAFIGGYGCITFDSGSKPLSEQYSSRSIQK